MSEIIINGVDVSECRYFNKETDYSGCGQICKNTPCEYKLQRLKAENESLKSLLDFEVQKREVLGDENVKLTFALEEIKIIAGNRFVSGLNEEADCYNNDMEMIETKINEALK